MLQLHKKNCFIKKKEKKSSSWSRWSLGWCSLFTTVCHVSYFWRLLHLFLSHSALGCSSLIHPIKSLLLSSSLPLLCPPQALAGSCSSFQHLYGLKNHRRAAKNVGEFYWIYRGSHMKMVLILCDSDSGHAPASQRNTWRRIRNPLIVSRWGHL